MSAHSGGLKPIKLLLLCKVGVHSEMGAVCLLARSSSRKTAGFCRKCLSLSLSLTNVVIWALKKRLRLLVFPAFGDQPKGQLVPGSGGKGRVPKGWLSTCQTLLVHCLFGWITTLPQQGQPLGPPEQGLTEGSWPGREGSWLPAGSFLLPRADGGGGWVQSLFWGQSPGMGSQLCPGKLRDSGCKTFSLMSLRFLS